MNVRKDNGSEGERKDDGGEAHGIVKEEAEE
jgi:hypothetical protein